MDVGAPLSRIERMPRVAARLTTPPFVLAGIVALSSLLQTVLAWRRPTPGYFPDEYMYAELGRSLLESGSPLVRGESAHFLPLLYPLLTAPAWLLDDVEQAYRAIQAVNAVTMSLAAIPAFLLARRLRVGDRLALAPAALAVLLPELLYYVVGAGGGARVSPRARRRRRRGRRTRATDSFGCSSPCWASPGSRR